MGQPNQGLELTGNSVRSCLAPALPRNSGPAFDILIDPGALRGTGRLYLPWAKKDGEKVDVSGEGAKCSALTWHTNIPE